MPQTLNINQLTAPGTYVLEDVAGIIPADIASFNRCYLIGSSASGTAKTPTQVTSADDFVTKFGASPSLNSVKLFFNNLTNGILFFVKAAGVTAADFIDAIEDSFDPDVHEQGILIAPEAFQNLATSDRTSVATAMHDLCATEGFDWIAFVDSGPSPTIDTPAEAQTESANYTAERGHLAYFFPYVKDLSDNIVPPSAGVAAIALRRYRVEGFQQPPAGVKYPMRGVKDVAVTVKKSEQATVNPNGVNCIRKLPGFGVVVYGSRTRSASPYYKFVNTRIILSVFNRTLFTAFEDGGIIFSAVDGQGVLFTRIRQTAEAIAYRFWDGGAFFGAQPKDAFLVRCDRTNNTALDLESGIVRCDIYVAPVPTLERLLITTYRVAIDQVQQAAGAA
ncbi:hypothetical protein GS682_04720 [Nostoc sp. B(2019)]|nr:hypothetical protein [Nostoc sp. B(2019)]